MSLPAHPHDGVVVAVIDGGLHSVANFIHNTKGLCHLLFDVFHNTGKRRIGKGLEVPYNSCYLELIIVEERVCLVQ